MITNSVFDQAIACADAIAERFKNTGKIVDYSTDPAYGISDRLYVSDRYRRAHISIVDARETKKLWLLHVTVFPHTNDPSPIYGFDIVAGPNKVSGAFHDFSAAGDADHPMLEWFGEETKDLTWNKKRELPEWAKQIFSNNMVAIGAVGSEELTEFVNLGLKSLDYYLANVGLAQQDVATYDMAQNRYCRYQKQNPHTPRVLVTLGFTEQQAQDFVQHTLFPEIG
jgi:hypothetical protein